MLVYNDNMNDRTPLTVAISKDNDKTWPPSPGYRRGGTTPLRIPMRFSVKTGRILVVYTTNETHHHYDGQFL